jgi:hypothetical protein
MSPLLAEDHIEVGVSLLRILRVDQMVVDQMVVDQMIVDQKVVDQMVVDQKVVDQMIVNQKVVDQMIVDQMTRNVYYAVVLNTGVKDLQYRP